MASNVIHANNHQQGDKKDKVIMSLVKKRLAEINTSMSTLTGRINDKDKRIEELKSKHKGIL